MNFDEAFEIVIGHEGGLVDHKNDPGGLTKFGVSQRSYPAEDIRNMTLDRARFLYRRDYWIPAGCDSVPPAVRLDLFDMSIHSGVRAAVKCLQGAAGAEQDGILGPRTLQAIGVLDGARLAARFNGARLQFLTDLSTWPTFSRGWARRIASNLMKA